MPCVHSWTIGTLAHSRGTRVSFRILPACQPILALGRAGTKRSGDAIPGGHCLSTATRAARSHMADEHLPRTGAPGASLSLTPSEPTAFPHRYPCVAGRRRPAGRGGTPCPVTEGGRFPG